MVLNRSAVPISPTAVAQPIAARMLSWSRPRRSSHASRPGPSSCRAASSADPRKESAWRLEMAGSSPLSGVRPPRRPDRLRRRASRVVASLALDQAVFEQALEAVHDVRSAGVSGDTLDRLERPPTAEHSEALEEAPIGIIQQVDAPGDRVPQGLLALRDVAPAALQVDRVARRWLSIDGGISLTCAAASSMARGMPSSDGKRRRPRMRGLRRRELRFDRAWTIREQLDRFGRAERCQRRRRR